MLKERRISNRVKKYAYGFPRLGRNREYKKLIEGFWNGKVSKTELRQGLDRLEGERLTAYQKYVDMFPIGEMTFYDQMLDTALIFGLYKADNLEEYFDLCRGKNALEMTKWFNTNYHYLVPDLRVVSGKPKFKVVWNKLKLAKTKYGKGMPYLIGPFTFLKLARGYDRTKFGQYLLALSRAYKELLQDFDQVHIDEPAFVMDLSQEELDLIKEAYEILGQAKTDIYLFTYYDSVDFLPDLYHLPVKAISLDFVNGKENLTNVKNCGFPDDKILIAGLVDGRNAWRTDIFKAVDVLKELSKYAKNLMVSNASLLCHLPVTIEGEELDKGLLSKLSFATERLYELDLISKVFQDDTNEAKIWTKDIDFPFGANDKVKKRVDNLKDQDFNRQPDYKQRAKVQKKVLGLPDFPTTTIGSFPQTKEIRAKRADFRAGRITDVEYRSFICQKIAELIKLQEDLDLDVLTHGEFERSDMVEFFAEKLSGIATTKKGWILSYGTRGYRPAIIYGDVSRPFPMTIGQVGFAHSKTSKPVKAILTGPVTIIAWSFVRADIPISRVAYQIGLALQDEIKDLEIWGIKIVQIDEPAFREKCPLKRKNWPVYFDWAVKSFKLCSSTANIGTQIHTHMCYSKFGQIMAEILKMDFDVISIEATRSGGDIIEVFERKNFDRQIGLGIWDIHSPAIPSIKEMRQIVKRALKVIPKENFWINPDCGLKTRKWEEVLPSLKKLVKLAKSLRKTKTLKIKTLKKRRPLTQQTG